MFAKSGVRAIMGSGGVFCGKTTKLTLPTRRSHLFPIQASIRFRGIFPHKQNHYLEIIFFIDNLFRKKNPQRTTSLWSEKYRRRHFMTSGLLFGWELIYFQPL